MKKYDCIFCHCGRIQLMPEEYIDWLSEDWQHRFILRICQNCGTTTKVFLDEYFDGYAICASEVRNVEYKPEELANCRIIMDQGIRVPIKNGLYAHYHIGSAWYDENGVGGGKSVDTQRLIREVNDEEKLSSISRYVTGIEWEGTPYEYKP